MVEKSTVLGGWTTVMEVQANAAEHQIDIPVDTEEEPRCFFRVRIP